MHAENDKRNPEKWHPRHLCEMCKILKKPCWKQKYNMGTNTDAYYSQDFSSGNF